VVVEDLAVGDGEQPAPQVRGVTELRVGPQRGDDRLLEAVGAVVGADLGHHEPVEVRSVVVEQRLEGRQHHHPVNAGPAHA
jgi:hypothetical protein